MSNAASKEVDIKWWDRRVLAPAVLAGLSVFALLWFMAEKAKPPAGYIFERLPVITGIYHDTAGLSKSTWVSGVNISCVGYSYYQFGGSSCGLNRKLYHERVEVFRVMVPNYWRPYPAISRLSSNGSNYIDFSDERMLEMWMSNSMIDAFCAGLYITLVLHFLIRLSVAKRLRNLSSVNKLNLERINT